MSSRKTSEKNLDTLIQRVVNDMELYGPDSEEYSKMVKHLESLNRMKSQKWWTRLSWDTVLIVLGNLLGILIIVAYEERNVISSKALSMTQKTKL
jgi:hypothetical protein